MISKQVRAWVTAILANDEGSSDDELVALFRHIGRLTEEEARAWIAQRDYYLRGGDIPALVARSRQGEKNLARLLIGEYVKIEAEIGAAKKRLTLHRFDKRWFYQRGVQQGLLIALALHNA